MIAMQRCPSKARCKRIDRIELDQPDSVRSHPIEKAARRQHRTEAVVDYIDLHALLLFRDQLVRELLPDLIAVEYVGFEIDVMRGALDRGKHRGAVLEQGHLVPRYQRTPADRRFESQMALQDVGLAAPCLEPLDDRVTLAGGKWTLRADDLEMVPVQPAVVDERVRIGHSTASTNAHHAGDQRQYSAKPPCQAAFDLVSRLIAGARGRSLSQ